MVKDYSYKGYTYFYSRHAKKWIVDADGSYIYLNTKQQCKVYIETLSSS